VIKKIFYIVFVLLPVFSIYQITQEKWGFILGVLAGAVLLFIVGIIERKNKVLCFIFILLAMLFGFYYMASINSVWPPDVK